MIRARTSDRDPNAISAARRLAISVAVPVGDGAATPALVGNRLYVYARQQDGEVIRCLDAATGKEVWQAKLEVPPATDPGGFAGPRSSPAVAEGKVVTISARGRYVITRNDTIEPGAPIRAILRSGNRTAVAEYSVPTDIAAAQPAPSTAMRSHAPRLQLRTC